MNAHGAVALTLGVKEHASLVQIVEKPIGLKGFSGFSHLRCREKHFVQYPLNAHVSQLGLLSRL